MVGDVATLVGNGWSRQANLTCWTSSWSEVACPSGVRQGYQRSGPRVIRWGVNALTKAGVDITLGSTFSRAFGVVFDEAGGADEGQIVKGDSGGAAFLKRDDQWQLVGIHFAIAPYAGQPNNTLAFGNTGYSVDVSHYRQEIEAILLPLDEVPRFAVGLADWIWHLAGGGAEAPRASGGLTRSAPADKMAAGKLEARAFDGPSHTARGRSMAGRRARGPFPGQLSVSNAHGGRAAA